MKMASRKKERGYQERRRRYETRYKESDSTKNALREMETEMSGRLHASRTNLSATFPSRQPLYAETAKRRGVKKKETSISDATPNRVSLRKLATQPRSKAKQKHESTGRRTDRVESKEPIKEHIEIPVRVAVRVNESITKAKKHDPQMRRGTKVAKVNVEEHKVAKQNMQTNLPKQTTYRTELEIPIQPKKPIQTQVESKKEKIHSTFVSGDVHTKAETAIRVPRRQDDIAKRPSKSKRQPISLSTEQKQAPVVKVYKKEYDVQKGIEKKRQDLESLDNQQTESSLRSYEHQEMEVAEQKHLPIINEFKHQQQSPGAKQKEDDNQRAAERKRQSFVSVDNQQTESFLRNYEHQKIEVAFQDSTQEEKKEVNMDYETQDTDHQSIEDEDIERATTVARARSLEYNEDCKQS